MTFQFDPGRLLLAGYVLCFIFANVVAFLVSAFYRKKFNQPSPQSGFVVAVILAAVYITSVFFRYHPLHIHTIVQILVVFAGAIASVLSAMSLYYTMKKRR
jgi:FtsH-binding integral membrane protein